MLNMQLDMAIKSEKQIERQLKKYHLVSNDKKAFLLDYIERQISFDLYLCNYLKKSKDEIIISKLTILELLLEKNTFFMSLINGNKVNSKNY